MVEAARIAYRDYPTVVNEVPESGLSYDNNKLEYAKMDIKMQGAQKAIGGSSDSAQLSQSYYWTKLANNEIDDDFHQLYENTVILAVCAPLAIDGCKRVYAVDVNNDIARIRAQECMNRKLDYPKFMKWTVEIPVTKGGVERPRNEIRRDKEKVKKRIDEDLVCPMNWLQDALDKVQNISKSPGVNTYEFLVKKPNGTPKATQMTKIRKIIEDYDGFTKIFMDHYSEEDDLTPLEEKTQEVINQISGTKMSKATIYRLVETSLGINGKTNSDKIYRSATKYTRKMLNMLYKTNKDKFLQCFIS